MTIEENISIIRDRIKSACIRSSRNTEDIKLIAVTKTIPVERILEAIQCGIYTLGENKVQEIVEKYPYIKSSVEWHMIGHLQSNKVKYIVDKVSMIHSVDNLKLAQEIDRRFGKSGRTIEVLVEINIGDEANKHGLSRGDSIDFVTEISKLKNIQVCGLMTVAPAIQDTELVRPYFKEMKNIFDNIKQAGIDNVNMKYLSMGMTNDFEVAIEEGANIIRIGTGIFGPRNYS